jgi:uncharacterized protein YkwD
MLHLPLSRRSQAFAAILLLLSALSTLTASQVAAQSAGKTSVPDPISSGPLPKAQDAPMACLPPFYDVHTTDFFFDGVRHLFCFGAIGGYPDNTFRPGNTTSRGQFSKIVVEAMGWPLLNPPTPRFVDVQPGSPFYPYVETASAHNVISGYGDGSFRPADPVSRGQLVKMVVLAEGWPLLNPPTPRFVDVQPGSPFYAYVETASAREVIGGYSDGTFRPGSTTSRGQVAKVVYYARNSVIYPTEQATIDLINGRRAAMGLSVLRSDPALHRAARRHVNDIGPLSLCQHNGTDGSSPWDRAAQAGYTGFAMGEVVGCNYPTPLSVVDGWWNSPGHYGILTSADARAIGCGWWVNAQGYGWQACITGDP